MKNQFFQDLREFIQIGSDLHRVLFHKEVNEDLWISSVVAFKTIDLHSNLTVPIPEKIVIRTLLKSRDFISILEKWITSKRSLSAVIFLVGQIENSYLRTECSLELGRFLEWREARSKAVDNFSVELEEALF